MKVNDVRYGQIQALLQFGLSVCEVSERLKLDHKVIRYWANRPAPSLRGRKARNAQQSRRQSKRRTLVRKLVEFSCERTAVRYTPVRRTRRERKVIIYPYQSPAAIARALCVEHHLTVSSSTVRNDLLEMGYRAVRRRKVPRMTSRHMEDRVAFGRSFLGRPAAYRVRIIYADEKQFDTNEAFPEAQWTRGSAGNARGRLHEQGAPRINAFIAIGVGFRFILVFKRTIFSAASFRTLVLNRLVRNALPSDGILMLDNAPAHQGSRAYLSAHDIEMIDRWPAVSPDCNPVEQINGILGRRVARSAPFGEEELAAFVEQYFWEIPQETIDRLVLSCEARWEAVIANQGRTIKP